MARAHKSKPDKDAYGDWFSEDDPPAWLQKITDENPHDVPSTFNYFVARAKYAQPFADESNENRLELLIASDEIATACTLPQLIELAHEHYPRHLLEPDEKRYAASLDAKVKARFILTFLKQLLIFDNAPAAMAHDLAILLESFHINVSEIRANVQRIILENKRLSQNKIAEQAGVNPSDLSQWLKSGLIIDPYSRLRRASMGENVNGPPSPHHVSPRVRRGNTR